MTPCSPRARLQTDVQGVYRAGCEKNEEDYKNKTDKAKCEPLD